VKLQARLEQLLEQEGLSLLSDPRRLEGFLRDGFPEQPRDVYLITEIMECGVLDRLRREDWSRDSNLRGCAEQLSAQSGVASNLALEAVRIWADSLPDTARIKEESTEDNKEPESHVPCAWTGTVRAVLGV